MRTLQKEKMLYTGYDSGLRPKPLNHPLKVLLRWSLVALAVQQGQETLGLQPITNTQISSHVHTAF